MTPASSRARAVRWALAAACATLIVFVLWIAWHKRESVLAAVPLRPALDGWPTELAARIADAETSAGAFWGGVDGLAELSALYHTNGYFTEARRCYAGLAQLDPDDGRWTYRPAMIAAGYGELEVAVDLLAATVRRAPDYVPARLRWGDILLKQDDVAGAAAIFAAVQAQSPDEPYSLLGLARCAIDRGDWMEARRRLETALRVSGNKLGYDLIVPVYEHLGLETLADEARGAAKASGAFRDFSDPWMEELNDRSFDAMQLSVAAGAAKTRGETAAARRWLERALSIAPDNTHLHFQLALLLLDLGDTRAARDQLVRCTELDPKFADGWAYLYGALIALGDEAGARQAFESGLAHCPDSPGLHRMRAKQLVAAGHLAEAIPFFQTSIRLRPTEADAYIELAMALLRLGRSDDAMTEFHRALNAEPEHPFVLMTLAFQAISSRDEPAARQWLGRVQQQPRVPRREVDSLLAAYQQTFGRPFARPGVSFR